MGFSFNTKNGITITMLFKKNLMRLIAKQKKIWVDKGSEFYNWLMKYGYKIMIKKCIQKWNVFNEGKSVVAEKFVRTLKNKIYKFLTSVSKNVYIDKLDEPVDKYYNTYHSAIKMKSVGVKSRTCMTLI